MLEQERHQMCSVLYNLPLESGLLQAVWKTLQYRRAQSIQVLDDHFYFENQSVNLRGKGKILQLLKVFCESESRSLSREELIYSLYAPPKQRLISIRQMECHHHNVVKLLSRTRQILKQSLDYPQICWLPYDPISASWVLHRWVT